MAHVVESLMYVGTKERNVPWHGLGTPIEEAPTSEVAIRVAGLDWEVEKLPIYTSTRKKIPNYFANTRTSDGSVLGVVGNRYQIVQNKDAFDFTDALIDTGDVRYETAGSLRDGKTVWMLARLPEQTLVGDKFVPYICFTNNHDGFGSIKVCMTPTRVVCNNTLNLALRTAHRTWSTKHVGDIQYKTKEALNTLKLSEEYMEELNNNAEHFATQKMSDKDVANALNIIFPVADDATERTKNNVAAKKEEIIICMMAPDLANFKGTKWQFLNAIADYTSHSESARKTESFAENRWGTIIGGHPIMDLAHKIVSE